METWQTRLEHRIPWAYIEDPEDNFPYQFKGRAEMLTKPAAEPFSDRLALPNRGSIPSDDWEESDVEPSPKELPVDAYLFRSNRFAWTVAGKSLSPYLLSGDQLLFQSTRQAVDGMIVLARSANRLTLKKASKISGEWHLETFDGRESRPMGDWTVEGVLVGVLRKKDGEGDERWHYPNGIAPERLHQT